MKTNTATSSTDNGWRIAHERLVRFAKRRARLEWHEGLLLRQAFVLRAHQRLGFASFIEYVEHLFGYGPRTTKEKLRVAEALEELPELTAALRRGDLTWSAARELTRVAIAETETTWLACAQGKTSREIEALVAGHALGNLPSDQPDARLVRHVLHFEVSAETIALFREALGMVRRNAGGSLDDDAALLLLARNALATAKTNPAGGGRSSYQIEVRACKHCERVEQLGNGTRVELSRAVAEMCECDSDHVGEGKAQPSIPRDHRRRVLRRDDGRCVVPGCNHAIFVDVHHLRPREDGIDHGLDNLACFCGAHHRAVHEGRLNVSGTPTTGLTFRHADGTLYGSPTVSAARADRNTEVFSALRGLGFRETESRAAINACAQRVSPDASREVLLRAAIALLTKGSSNTMSAA